MASFRSIFVFMLVSALLAPFGTAQAGSVTDVARQFLQQQTQNLGDKVTVTVRAPTARLPACLDPTPFLPGHGQQLIGLVTVGIRCRGGQLRYLQARVTATGTYWVASQQLAAGTTITRAMLETRSGDLGKLPHGAIRQSAAAVGKVTTRFVSPGAVLMDSALKAPVLVHRRQVVTVEARGKAFRVTRQGKALQDGGLGDSIRVRMANRSILVGVVSAKDLVEVRF